MKLNNQNPPLRGGLEGLMDILRFITAGSVDDGKSTLIGRLLYDSKSIMIDQLEAIEKQTKNREEGEIDLALLTDGLRAEREQGITIDVAYKYFSTPKRKFIIADAPGHIQYTRNMVTGASNSDLIIVLIDARQGVVEQTRRHSIIASLLNIPHIIVAINKMDLVNYSQDVYNNIVIDYAEVAKSLGLKNVTYIPISALNGDNIVETSVNFPWYEGESLLHLADDIDISRGDMIVLENNQPKVEQEIEVLLNWMDKKPLKQGNKYLLQIGSKTVKSVIREVEYKIDVNTLQQLPSPEEVQLNDVVKATIKTASPIAFDSYKQLRTNGGVILIDETSYVTVGACMIQ